MPPLAGVILLGIEELIKLSPPLIAELQTLFAKKDATPQDWADMRKRVGAKSYHDYVPASVLPKTDAANP